MMIEPQELYSRLPILAQNLACSAYGARLIVRRYDAEYRQMEIDAIQRECWSRDAIEKLRWERLYRTLNRAAQRVPYYRDQWQKLGVSVNGFKAIEDLSNLPILTRQEVQRNLDNIIPKDLSRSDVSIAHTSGTTGTGLVFPVNRQCEKEQWAVWWRYRRRFGLDRKTWYGHFYGKLVVPHKQTNPPFWRINFPGRQILFSGYHMREDFLGYYVEELNRRCPPWIQGYPSLLVVLSGFMLDSGRRLSYQPRIVTAGAETLLEHQKRLIEEAFGAPCRQHYGMAEAVANISECPEGRLHVDEDFGLIEFLPTGDGRHRIIATGFSNDAFPLIRYDTGDVATLPDKNVTCQCGLPGRIVKAIDGRIEDIVITADGRRIGRLDHILKDFTQVREAQIIQNKKGQILVRIVRGERFHSGDKDLLIAECKKWLGSNMQVSIEFVHELQRTNRGKLRFVISSIGQESCRV